MLADPKKRTEVSMGTGQLRASIQWFLTWEARPQRVVNKFPGGLELLRALQHESLSQ